MKPSYKLPPNVPARGNWFSRGVGRFLLWCLGWKAQGVIPDVKKLVLIVAPHTSNWDFVVGVACYLAYGLRASWFGKHTIFRWPFGYFLSWLGGIPVKRSSRHGFVDQLVDRFKKSDGMVLALSPEGTRKKTEWKKGFYYIALGADVPILLVSLDFPSKTLEFGPIVRPDGNYQAQLEEMMAYFKSKTARRPDLF